MAETIPEDVTAGAVDLANPVQRCLRDFATQLAVSGGIAVVAVAMTANGNLVSTAHVPAGIVQALGLLTVAQQQLSSGMMRPNVPNTSPPPEEAA